MTGAISFAMRGLMRGLAAVAAMGAQIGLLAATLALADEFSITGTYTQNVSCKGDGTDPAVKVVRITEVDIHSSFGICKFVKKEHAGNVLAAQMSCDGPGGNILLGDVRFTVRADKNIDFVDQDNTYKSVLYRCPQTDAAAPSPTRATSAR